MNDLLGVVVAALGSEYFKIENFENLSKTKEDDGDEENESNLLRKVFLKLHDPAHLWADAFTIFERVMNAGIKELYYRDLRSESMEATEASFSVNEPSLSLLLDFDDDSVAAERAKVQRFLREAKEDNKRTAIKKRANKIFASYLKDIDSELYFFLQTKDMQPEFIFLRWLRCMLAREFALENVFKIWDYIFSGIN